MLHDYRHSSSICPFLKASDAVYLILSRNRTEILKENFQKM